MVLDLIVLRQFIDLSNQKSFKIFILNFQRNRKSLFEIKAGLIFEYLLNQKTVLSPF